MSCGTVFEGPDEKCVDSGQRMGGALGAPTYTVIGTEYFISRVRRRQHHRKRRADGEFGSGSELWDFEY